MVQVIPEFISPEEEKTLLSNLKPSRVSGGFKRNKILRYGSDKPYKAGKKLAIPHWLMSLVYGVAAQWRDLGIHHTVPDHVTINEYMPGQYIDWHIDSPGSGPIITVLSLECTAKMGLKWTPEGETQERSELISLPERSLLHMTEEDRWDKEHCTYPVDSHRWSIVFRKGT
jgi:alkylated DNA repair dioxygenase AlkB